MTTDWGRAKFEVGVLWEEILARLETGSSIRAVYNELRTDGRIGICERSFYRCVKRLRGDSGQASVSPPRSGPDGLASGRLPLDGTPAEAAAPGRAVSDSDADTWHAWDEGLVEPVFGRDLGPYGGPDAPPSSPPPQSSKESSSHGPD